MAFKHFTNTVEHYHRTMLSMKDCPECTHDLRRILEQASAIGGGLTLCLLKQPLYHPCR